jgi:hypothetical protein
MWAVLIRGRIKSCKIMLKKKLNFSILSRIRWLETELEFVISFTGLLGLQLQLIIKFSQIYMFNKSLQHALSLLIHLCLHRLSPGNTSSTTYPSVYMFHASGPRWLALISRQSRRPRHCWAKALNNGASSAIGRLSQTLTDSDCLPSNSTSQTHQSTKLPKISSPDVMTI